MPLTLLPDPESHTVALGERTRPGSTPAGDTRVDRLLKVIPTEVIAVYPMALALAALIAWPYYELTMAALGMLAVVLVLRHDGAIAQRQPMQRQHIFRCLIFMAWTMVVGNPLATWSVTTAHVHLFGAVGTAFLPCLGYLVLGPTSAA